MCIELKFEDSHSESYCYNHSTMESRLRSFDVSTIKRYIGTCIMHMDTTLNEW